MDILPGQKGILLVSTSPTLSYLSFFLFFLFFLSSFSSSSSPSFFFFLLLLLLPSSSFFLLLPSSFFFFFSFFLLFLSLIISLILLLFRHEGGPQLHPVEGPKKIHMFKERYSVLKQRLLRHELFNPPPNAPSNATHLKVNN